ncbi:hypothetical protein LTR37_010539 [Vermiconidia calcicola]|uniref:Uncharacterized protein n=1 Tax=Vermiconidia calcicola TaxID=1690605 RepID=A0ACC3N503_9PEZI|nr:hypothetical protein LTR37_010539 [Vermiconidia calcicola]
MTDKKDVAIPLEKELGHELTANGDVVEGEHGSTESDRYDMYHMGKVQQMRRIFRLFPMFSFCMILMATWEISLGASTISLFNGGTAGTIYMYIVCWIGFLSVYSSMAELGSMAPTSGGQYHWVSEFAPAKYQKILSYAVGWLSVLGWQIAVTSTAFQAGAQIQGLLVLNYEWYVFERWHGTLLIMAVVAFAVFFNTFLAKQLPMMEVLLLIFHVCGFFCVLIPLLILSKRSPSDKVWTEFFDSGWGSYGTSTLVGIIANVIPFLGADAAAHMSEELQDASYTLPRTMMYSTLANGALGLIMIIAYCYCIGDILEGSCISG